MHSLHPTATLLLALALCALIAGCAASDNATLPASPAPATALPAAPVVESTAAAQLAADPSPTATDTPAAPATPTPEPEPAAATPTAAPAEASPTPGVMALVTGAAVNLRSGPGADFEVLGQASQGQRYPALARTAAGDWWQIDVDGLAVWINAGLVSLEGDPAALPLVQVDAPPPAAAMPVQVYEIELTIPTYPYAAFSVEAVDPVTNWTFRRFDRPAYEGSNPQPVATAYRGVVLENEYLRIVLLPELGGRIYQVIFKPTGSNQLYQNPVLKPSPWGPPGQGGWLAAGGIEWGLPVAEHGYVWGDAWGHITNRVRPDAATVTVFMPDTGRLRADVDVTLRAGEAAFTIQPRIVNPAGEPATYQFWIDAMLAPGPANRPGPNLRFLLPTDLVTVHSRGDEFLPAAGEAMAWPVFNEVDFSRLGNWNDWLGVFERPAAHGPFAGVYDPDADEGLVRVFPPLAAPGSKIFAMGWAAPIDPAVYTDDGSAYAELHGGVTPTYDDEATLAGGATYTWQETWFPVAGIGGVSYADGGGAVSVAAGNDGLAIGVFPVRAVAGRVQIAVDGELILEEPVDISPAQPYRRTVAASGVQAGGRVAVTLFDQSGAAVINYR